MTPYNTGRVQIGACWTPRPRTEFGHYELLVQRALLDRSTLTPLPLWQRILRGVYAWL